MRFERPLVTAAMIVVFTGAIFACSPNNQGINSGVGGAAAGSGGQGGSGGATGNGGTTASGGTTNTDAKSAMTWNSARVFHILKEPPVRIGTRGRFLSTQRMRLDYAATWRGVTSLLSFLSSQ